MSIAVPHRSQELGTLETLCYESKPKLVHVKYSRRVALAGSGPMNQTQTQCAFRWFYQRFVRVTPLVVQN